ncbi:uncharacterized protein LOC114308232 [Camellia sinensis]|uniref:uncharacterized protein LOC114308232 n=1 Tax=Camellia sinensis TaxID=4442 RepID=UPI001036D5BC|nr:uncharacterized protein LOC114308232 [Camellia sinensis]
MAVFAFRVRSSICHSQICQRESCSRVLGKPLDRWRRRTGSTNWEYEVSDVEIVQLEEDTWKLYFDGATNQCGYGIRVLLIASDDLEVPLAFKLQFEVSNNQAEYKARIVRRKASLELGAIRLDVIGDSKLVVSQANGDWKVKEEKMKVHHQTLDMVI